MNSQKSIWENAKSLLVFYVFVDHEEFQQFRASLDEVLIDSNVKRLKVIIQNNDPKESVLKHSLFSYISEKDITLFGNKIKKKSKNNEEDQLNIICLSHYDMFLCFGNPSDKILKWLKKINTSIRIGVNSEDNYFFDMNLQSSFESIEKSVIFANKTLNKII